MSNKRKLASILGVCGATVLAGGGSAFLTNTGLSLLDSGWQTEQESEVDPGEVETETPISVEQFSKTADSFVISAKTTSANGQKTNNTKTPAGESGNSGADGGSADDSTMYTTLDLNVRSSAGTESEILGTIPEGDSVTLTGRSDGNWVEVSYDGTTGYVSSSYLTSGGGTGSSGTSAGGSSSGSGSYSGSSSGAGSSGGSSGGSGASASVATTGTMYATAGVNVRSGPNKKYSVLGAIDTGEGIGVTGNETDGWIEVVYNGQIGYIYQSYLVWNQSDVNSGGSSSSSAWDDSYYMYDVDSRSLSASELDGWSASDLAILRNEIFARHGRIFTTPKYRDYFAQKTWYHPTYDPSYFDANLDSFLNSYEWANLALIQKLEDQRS